MEERENILHFFYDLYKRSVDKKERLRNALENVTQRRRNKEKIRTTCMLRFQIINFYFLIKIVLIRNSKNN